MIRTRYSAAFAAIAVAATLTSAGAAQAQSPGAQGAQAAQGRLHRPVCGPPVPGHARCHSRVVTRTDGASPLAGTSPSTGAYVPADLQAAYALATSGGVGRTVAIVDALDNPSAEADLAAYRSRFGLPACTTANGCFRKANQSGASSPLPKGDTGWGQEIDLDLQMASAACPNCRLVLVEANSTSFADLAAGVDTAANVLHANAISNSYGGSEFSSETSASYEGHYNHPGVAITVSSGDNGYGVEFPAASRYVTAVGGTSLSRATSSRGWTEAAWSGAGSGCSAYVAKPSWQTDSGCGMRTVADVSAVADPNTGVAVYDSYGSTGGANWYVFGGTSVAAPIVAGVYALAGNTAGVSDASALYSRRTSLNDATTGSNGTCTVAYLCAAQVGYDGPTGLGTPKGTAAFGGVTSPPPPVTQPVLGNPGFESGTLSSWSSPGLAPAPGASNARAHAGSYSARLGTVGTNGTEPSGDSTLAQSVAIPSSVAKATLSFWYWPATTDSVTYDWQEAQIRSSTGAVLAQVMHTGSNAQAWTQVNFDATAYKGQTVQLWFNVHQDGYGDLTYMYLDDVSVTVS